MVLNAYAWMYDFAGLLTVFGSFIHSIGFGKYKTFCAHFLLFDLMAKQQLQ